MTPPEDMRKRDALKAYNVALAESHRQLEQAHMAVLAALGSAFVLYKDEELGTAEEHLRSLIQQHRYAQKAAEDKAGKQPEVFT
jgi:hypothetical protein